MKLSSPLIRSLKIYAQIRIAPPPAPLRFLHPNTARRFHASNSAAATHKVKSQERARPMRQSDDPAPPRRHSHLLLPDQVSARASPPSLAQRKLRSAQQGPHRGRDPIRFSSAIFLRPPPAPSSPISAPRRSQPARQFSPSEFSRASSHLLRS